MDGLVVLPGGFVVHREPLDGLCGQRLRGRGRCRIVHGLPFVLHKEKIYPNVDDGIRPVAFQRVELQVPLKVPRVQARDGQAVPVTSLREKTPQIWDY